MNILGYAPQMAAYGGMERHVCDLAGVLASRGHHVTLVTTSNSLGTPLRATLAAQGVTLRELSRGRGGASRLQKLLWLLRESLRCKSVGWDVIYTNGQSALARMPWLAARANTRIVHHHHTAADAAEQATWSRAFRRVLQTAPEIVACSHATQQALRHALRRDDVRFLPYLTSAPIPFEAVANRNHAPGAPLRFGFTGRLVAEKGIGQICALSRHPALGDISWHLHGAGRDYPPDYFAGYTNIVYHGAFSGAAQHAEILQNLDAVVLFSTHNEGMPLSLIEAMSAGLPWIATDRGGTREMAISPGNSLVVPHPATIETLVAAVRTVADRLQRNETSRVEQRRAYDRFFSPAVVAEAWCRYLEQPEPKAARSATAVAEPERVGESVRT